jgi:hypothetical protein
MTTLLKRLSMSLDLERRSSFAAADHSLREPGAARGVAASTSFNDFSMHVGQEGAPGAGGAGRGACDTVAPRVGGCLAPTRGARAGAGFIPSG